MLTNKDYCDYETCVALMEIGYPPYAFGDKLRDEHFANISLYEAQKWLREEKDIHIEVYACAGGYIYELCKTYKPNSFSGGTTIYTPNDVDNPKLNDAGRYETYEEALLEGIKEAVKILKESKMEEKDYKGFVALVRRMREAQKDVVYKSVFSALDSARPTAYEVAKTKQIILEQEVDEYLKNMKV